MHRKSFYYKGMRVNAFGIPVSRRPKTNPTNEKSRRVRDIYNVSFSSAFQKNSPKNLIVMYDIPESKKKERDWFRRQLRKFDYMMIHRSVWVGPSPLPKDFLDYVKSIGLQKQLKKFKLAKPYKAGDAEIN